MPHAARPSWLDRPPGEWLDARRRVWVGAWLFLGAVIVVFLRGVYLERAQGAAFRALANEVRERVTHPLGPRGRLLSADGEVLACDQEQSALALHYRWLEDPPDATWLRQTARARLLRKDRKDTARIDAAAAAVLAERAASAARLQRLIGISADEWRQRAMAVQTRVERIAAGVRRRQQSTAGDVASPPPTTLGPWIVQAIRDAAAPPPEVADASDIVIAEELAHHVIVDELPPSVAEEIENHAERYPGAKVVRPRRRVYPQRQLAAHLIGYLGEPPTTSDRRQPEADGTQQSEAKSLPHAAVGQTGVERQYEEWLRPSAGTLVERIDHRGRAITSTLKPPPPTSCDLRLTIDSRLQAAAEQWLDQAVERARLQAEDAPQAGVSYDTTDSSAANASRATSFGNTDSALSGGAVVVLDVHSGAVRAMASSPRFEPAWFRDAHRERAVAALGDRARPMFDRGLQMAIPPGSVFKTIAALALLQTATVRPHETFFCRGFLRQPDRQRCEIFTRFGRGHGEVDLSDALTKSCNVYFFEYAGRMGPAPLVAWAQRFGFGAKSGVDLPFEAAGHLPTAAADAAQAWSVDDTRMLAVGQGALTATPLQIARMMAAVANGGQLVTPYCVEEAVPSARSQASGGSLSSEPSPLPRPLPPRAAPVPIDGLDPASLLFVRQALERVVGDEEGTAHATVFNEELAVAGKTGTAELDDGRAPHAWFAGYAPADDPQVAIVVVVEHGGGGAAVAGPVVKRLVLRMFELGMFAAKGVAHES